MAKRVKPNPPPPHIIKRPRCPGCGVKMKPFISTETKWNAAKGEAIVISRAWTGEYHGYGAFCSLRCAARWANRQWDQMYKQEGE